MRHTVLITVVTLIALPVAAQDAPSDASSTVNIGLPYNLASVLEPLREKHDLPALAAAVILDGRTYALGVVGVRKSGTDVNALPADPFHMGSCTKAMTATLIAMLVEQGKLRWDTTIAEIFPELAGDMDPTYRNVTVDHLLAHRSGLPGSGASWPGTE